MQRPCPLKKGGSYLITGGLGGIGLALAAWLAQVASARLLLTSRRSLPPRDAWEGLLAGPPGDEENVPVIKAIRDIEAMGGKVMTAVADAADFAAMQAAIDKCRECWGALDGVIHAAGVPGNGRLAVLQDDQETRSVLAPKVDGLRVLVQLLGDAQLDFVALMSSISSVVGSPGACGYAAANAVFDSFVERAQRGRSLGSTWSLSTGERGGTSGWPQISLFPTICAQRETCFCEQASKPRRASRLSPVSWAQAAAGSS